MAESKDEVAKVVAKMNEQLRDTGAISNRLSSVLMSLAEDES
jgi:hypothetical protein